MKMSKGIGLGALLVAAVLLAVILAPSISANVNKTKSEKALDHISQKYGKMKVITTDELAV